MSKRKKSVRKANRRTFNRTLDTSVSRELTIGHKEAVAHETLVRNHSKIKALACEKPLKLHLGCGYKILDGYVNIDLYSPAADLKMDIVDLSCFKDSSVDEIYLNAVFEHLYVFEQMKALAEWWRVLKPGGKLVMRSIPDFDEIARAYISAAPGNDGLRFDIEEVSRYTHGAYGRDNRLGQIHKDVFTKPKMRKLLERVGFKVISMENVCYADEPNPVNLNIVAVKPAENLSDSGDSQEQQDALVSNSALISADNNVQLSVAAVYCTHDDDVWLLESIESIYEVCNAIYVLVGEKPWFGEPGDFESVIGKLESFPDELNKIRVVRGNWKCEADQRNAGLDILEQEQFTYCLVIDTDEIYDPVDLTWLLRIAQRHPNVDCWHVEMDTYWKSWMYRIHPREQLKPAVLLKVGRVRFTQNRNVGQCTHGLVGPEIAVCHHLSYARSDAQLVRKLATFSHAGELVFGWYENVWKKWDTNRFLKNLHPTHPSAYMCATVQPYWALPPVLRRRYDLEAQNGGLEFDDYCRQIRNNHLASIIVLTLNQLGYTKRCLESIEKHTSVPYEVIVVDNGSSDGTIQFLQQWVSKAENRRVVYNADNLGFAKGSNIGIARANGQYIVLVNNDVVVTPKWLERLLACAARDASIGIVGALTNAVSGPQCVEQPVYDTESLVGLDDFAKDWAQRHLGQRTPAVRVVGFCMLVRKSVIDNIGGFDERFGLGNFEDDDFCLRSALAGFKTMIARDCFVHHYGSRTFLGERIDYRCLMSRNWELFKEKWGLPRDLPLGAGYDASTLLKQQFDHAVHYVPLPHFSKGEPFDSQSCEEKDEVSTASDVKPLLSLCMIVRNEEQFIEFCLASVRDVVDEIIVVDTGSTDRTAQISRQFGAKVYHYVWSDDYSAARNEAAKRARGEWILFMDADEVLDAESKHILRQAVEHPIADAYELLFYNYCSTDSSFPDIVHRVCRLYRNRPEYRFRGRVHENVATSIQEAGGLIAELDVVVHHYGYRPDVKNQRNKQERYLALLHAELEEKPDDIYVLFHLSAAYCAEGEFEKAIPYLEKLVDLVPPSNTFAPQSFSRLMNAYWAVGRSEDALKIASRAEELHVVHPEISFSKGNALLALERYSEALEAFREAIELGAQGKWLGDPGTYSHKARFGIARALAGLGRYDEALKQLRQLLDEHSNYPSAHELAALLCSQLGDIPGAEVHWREFLRLVPTSTETCLNLAEICETQGRYQEAIGHYFRAIENCGESSELYQKIATCYEMMGDLANAEKHYIKAISVDPHAAEAYNDLGRLHASRGDIQSALDCFAKAVEVKPEYANAYFNAADLLYKLGKYLEAAEIYESGLARDPSRAEAFLALGNCCYKLGALNAAVLAYKQALCINQDYEEAKNNLALAEEALKETAA